MGALMKTLSVVPVKLMVTPIPSGSGVIAEVRPALLPPTCGLAQVHFTLGVVNSGLGLSHKLWGFLSCDPSFETVSTVRIQHTFGGSTRPIARMTEPSQNAGGSQYEGSLVTASTGNT
eukprot:2140166-Amphidinium_carterae.1